MTFDPQPTLTSELSQIRPLQAEDFPALFDIASDPLRWEQYPCSDRYQEAVFRTFFDDALNSGGALIATDVETDAVIGASRYHDYNATKSEVEIGWTFLARTHWGGKYKGEMKRLMLLHAFQFVDSVVFLVGLRQCSFLSRHGESRRRARRDANRRHWVGGGGVSDSERRCGLAKDRAS